MTRVGLALWIGWAVTSGGCSLLKMDDDIDIGRPECSRSISGTDGPDNLAGDQDEHSQDCIDGRAGNDTIDGEDDDDVVIGGEGADTLRGSDGEDWLYANPTDAIDGGGGVDTLVFDPGLLLGTDRVDLAAYRGRVQRVEVFRLDGTLTLTPDDAQPMVVQEVGQIVVDALPLGSVVLEGTGWMDAGENVEQYGATYHIYYGVADLGPIELAVNAQKVDASGLTP